MSSNKECRVKFFGIEVVIPKTPLLVYENDSQKGRVADKSYVPRMGEFAFDKDKIDLEHLAIFAAIASTIYVEQSAGLSHRNDKHSRGCKRCQLSNRASNWQEVFNRCLAELRTIKERSDHEPSKRK